MPLSEGIAESATAKRSWLAWGVATVIFIAFALLAFVLFREVPPQVQVLSSYIIPSNKAVFLFANNYGLPALSPDGRHLVFAATTEDGKSQLWVRPLDTRGAQPLLGTEGATLPFWSPGNRHVGFFADGKLKIIDIAAGTPVILTDAPDEAVPGARRESLCLRPPPTGPFSVFPPMEAIRAPQPYWMRRLTTIAHPGSYPMENISSTRAAGRNISYACRSKNVLMKQV
jgi:hypothetical protein